MPTAILSPLPPLACLLPLPLGELTQKTGLASVSTPASTLDATLPSIAAAAALTAPEVISIELSGDPFGPSFLESMTISASAHENAGLDLKFDTARDRLRLMACTPGTLAARISHWRSRLGFAYILSLSMISTFEL
jgi:hypothetical protein